MKKILFFLAILSVVSMQAQDGNLPSLFRQPFDFPLYLSGNFGELRSNHFHGGIDFKTQGVEGKQIHCIADGYISRASISPGGYGNAIYVTHDNGYTSVYGHLQKFPPRLAHMLREFQYTHETFVVDTIFTPDVFPVKRGEVIALAGNSGYSFGPHLHMEIRETETNEPIDPLLFYQDKIKDTTPPRATSLMVYPQKGRGMLVGKGSHKQAYSFAKSKDLSEPIKAWGVIGTAISANDYMDGTTNRYGVYSVTLSVDGEEIFSSTVDRFFFSENRLINSWVDYDEYIRHGKWYMKSFIAPGNSLRMLQSSENRGWVDICEERDYHFEYRLSDLYGNTSVYRFIVQGEPSEIPLEDVCQYTLSWDRSNLLQKPGMQLWIPRGVLYEDHEMDIDVSTDTMAVSYVYRMGEESVPMHENAFLSIGVLNNSVVDTTKYYMAGKRGKWRGSVGGRYENGWVKARIRDLGVSYFVAVDTVAPRVEPIKQASWRKTGIVSFRISDTQTGIASYKGTMNGEFVLFEYSSKNRRLTCRLKETPVSDIRPLALRLVVTDGCGNETVYESVIK
ncbi:MAG: M23 family metallopeptidase [Bacteroidaceae bacterium]|nr:M23 family metallopeptidase [Bacteroidaceae bacterium]